MQISEHTSQAELERLYTAVVRRELLQGTPLNLRMFLRYAVLFVLFPGMVGGFRVGVGLTLIFCLVLGGLLLGDMQSWAVSAVRVWLTAGGCVLVWVIWGTVRSALALWRTRRIPRPADTPLPAAVSPMPAAHRLRWHRSQDTGSWEAELELPTPSAGICALMLQIEGAGRGRLLTPERRGVCMVQSTAQGSDLQSLLLYRLLPGTHRLRWLFVPAERMSTPPRGEVTLLTLPPA